MATRQTPQRMDPEFWTFLSDFVQQNRPPDADSLKAGNELTLSLFSELQYAVGAPSSAGGPAQQRLPILVTSNDYLVLTKRPPPWARTMRLVRTGHPEMAFDVPEGDPPEPVYLDPCLGSVIAVKFAEGPNAGDAVRLVSFVTYVNQSIYTDGECRSDDLDDDSSDQSAL
jgi:hypothetical protein